MATEILHIQIPVELDAKLDEMIAGLKLLNEGRVTKKMVVMRALEKAYDLYAERHKEKVDEIRHLHDAEGLEELF
jgi:hypothetical protein